MDDGDSIQGDSRYIKSLYSIYLNVLHNCDKHLWRYVTILIREISRDGSRSEGDGMQVPKDIEQLSLILSDGGNTLITQPVISQFILAIRKMDDENSKSNK